MEQVSKQYTNNNMVLAKSLLASTNEHPSLGSFRGDVFEAMAHALLSAGGKFIIRELVNRTELKHEKTLTIDRSEIERYDSIAEVINENQYYRPNSSKAPTFDSIIIKNSKLVYAFQMTIAERHDIKKTGLLQIQERFADDSNSNDSDVDDPTEIHLYFVVPDSVFDQWKSEQKVVSSKKNQKKKPPDFKQYVLKILFDDT
jgi:hypothetical protein